MKEFLNHLLGNQSADMAGALTFFGLMGALINLLYHANQRDQNSTRTPEQFSFKFLIWDNWKRIAFVVLLILSTVRFAGPILHIDTENKEMYLFYSFLIGLFYDILIKLWKEKGKMLKVKKDD